MPTVIRLKECVRSATSLRKGVAPTRSRSLYRLYSQEERKSQKALMKSRPIKAWLKSLIPSDYPKAKKAKRTWSHYK